MALVLKDRVKETTTTTGTGSFALAGAVTGYDSFGQIGSGNTTYYAVYLDGGSEWEVGIGTYTSPSTLSRDTILASSNAGSVVTFSAGQKTIWCDYPAGKAVYSNASGNIENASLTSPKINEILDANGNEVLGLLSTASATDYVGIKNGIGVGVPTSVSGTAPVVSSGGTTPAISMPAATSSVNGYLTSTDWTTFNSKGNGTVTSVAALTLGTTGTDLSSTVANGTTTPVITLNVPTASATNRGALSSADWTTFNSKAAPFTYTSTYIPFGQGTTTPNQSANLTFDGTTQAAPIQRASNGILTNNKTIGTSFTIPSTDNATSAGPVTLSSGVVVTVSSGSRWVVL
jgi:hypothetical protein